MATKHRTKTKKQTAIQTTETMSNTGLTKYYEADEWTKMMVKGIYWEREVVYVFFIYIIMSLDFPFVRLFGVR